MTEPIKIFIPPKIEGGYFLTARKIAESSLMTMPLTCFKLAVWLLAKARYEDYKMFDKYQGIDIIIKRGELTFTMTDAVEKTLLTYSQVRTALRRLFQHGFCKEITATKPKLAKAYMHITICKYEDYQNPNNYYGEWIANGSQRDEKGVANQSQLLNKDNKDNKDNKEEKEVFSGNDQTMAHLVKLQKANCSADNPDKIRDEFDSAVKSGIKPTEIEQAISKPINHGRHCWVVAENTRKEKYGAGNKQSSGEDKYAHLTETY